MVKATVALYSMLEEDIFNSKPFIIHLFSDTLCVDKTCHNNCVTIPLCDKSHLCTWLGVFLYSRLTTMMWPEYVAQTVSPDLEYTSTDVSHTQLQEIRPSIRKHQLHMSPHRYTRAGVPKPGHQGQLRMRFSRTLYNT